MPAAINMMSATLPGWRKYLFNSAWRYLLRILFALSGCAGRAALKYNSYRTAD